MWRPHLSIFLIIINLSFIFALSSRAVDLAEYGKIRAADWAVEVPEEYPETDALIILSQVHNEMTKRTVNSHYLVRIKIFTKEGSKQVGEQSFYYLKDEVSINSLKARTVFPDGTDQPVSRNSIFTRQAKNGNNQKVIVFSNPVPGSIIEYSYTMKRKESINLPTWNFQTFIYTLKSTFSVTLDNGYQFRANLRNVHGADKVPLVDSILTVGNHNTKYYQKTYSWTLENLPPVIYEPFQAPFGDFQATLDLNYETSSRHKQDRRYTRNFESSGRYLHDKFSKFISSKKVIKKKAREITKDATSDIEKSKLLYQFVTTQIKNNKDYTDFPWTSGNSSEVLNSQIGSPQEKNILLVAMHKELKINAWPVAITTTGRGSNPDYSHYDHIIAYIEFGESYVLLDCEYKRLPFGLMPPTCQVEGGILVDRKDGRLIDLTTNNISSYRTDRTIMTIDEDANAQCRVTSTMGGFIAAGYVSMVESQTAEDFIKSTLLKQLYLENELDSATCDFDNSNQLVAHYSFQSEELAKLLGPNLSISPLILMFAHNPFGNKRRYSPIDFSFPFTYTNIVGIKTNRPPTDFQLPKDYKFSIEGASFVRMSEVRDSTIYVVQKLDITQRSFKRIHYRELKGFFSNVSIVCQDQIIALDGE